MNIKLPKHIGIIMDGNGRWAKKRLLPKKLGHEAGAEALNKLLKQIEKTSIRHVTVYAFSTENWKREKKEVDELMKLLKKYIDEYIKKVETSNLKVSVIGDTSVLDEDLRHSINKLENLSSKKTGLHLHIALNYGSRDEIVRTLKKLAKKVKNNELNPEEITEKLINENLDTKDCPEPDLIIRTSGEVRLSNFLLWQSAYSELYFCEKLWPDFTFDDLKLAIDSYNKRERRFGKRNEEN